MTGATRLKLDVISKLRCDANLRYLYTGVQKTRGRKRKYDGKVDLTDLTRLTWVETVQPKVDLYTQRVWHVSLKREIRVVYLVDRRAPNRVRTALLFSTDVEQDPKQIIQFYKLRFGIEISQPQCPHTPLKLYDAIALDEIVFWTSQNSCLKFYDKSV